MAMDLSSLWQRWLGPAAVLAGGIVFFAAGSLHRQATALYPPLCDLSLLAPAGEQVFLAENDQAMARMMTDMTIRPSGDADRDFVEMMVPHHQAAIAMAQALLRHGENEALKRLAQEIIVTQQQEIAAMRLAVGEPLPPSAPAPDQAADLTMVNR